MREIKFRAWDKYEHKMSEPFVFSDITGEDGNEGYIDAGNMQISPYEMLKRYEFIQDTGVKDKNGKAVYEGYIIRTVWSTAIGEDYNVPQIVECPPLIPDNFHWYAELEDMEIEVIGNIFENGDLLNK